MGLTVLFKEPYCPSELDTTATMWGFRYFNSKELSPRTTAGVDTASTAQNKCRKVVTGY